MFSTKILIVISLLIIFGKFVFCDYEKEIKSISIYHYNLIDVQGKDIESINVRDIRNRPVKVLIHGWVANKNHISIEPVKNAYLLKGSDNVLIVDWSEPAHLFYDQSRNLVKRVGYRIGELLETFLKNSGISVEKVHIIGHSLGSHVAGNVGKYFKGKINRITGLDPAGPLFDLNLSDALSKSDAYFVDVIHTAGNTLGYYKPIGHTDFYPNQGITRQPGCDSLDVLTAFSCSHYRAPIFFAESILLPRNFLAVKCSIDEIENSPVKCQSKINLDGSADIVLMGENTPLETRGLYYLHTNNVFPYGKGDYYYH